MLAGHFLATRSPAARRLAVLVPAVRVPAALVALATAPAAACGAGGSQRRGRTRLPRRADQPGPRAAVAAAVRGCGPNRSPRYPLRLVSDRDLRRGMAPVSAPLGLARPRHGSASSRN